METRAAVSVSVDAGIDGDARGKKRGRQISILFEDDWTDAVAETGDAIDWTERRANILVTGMRSPQAEGGVFSIGGVKLEVAMETDPCEIMEGLRPGLRKAMTPGWRGGVCCTVLEGGDISIGDDVSYTD
ncbi:MAG: MOSC domain-containing protein [Alphaproteobacteria bacterium]|nr:MOSC domain-containing protein [Alphaproteobacteria bacterium]